MDFEDRFKRFEENLRILRRGSRVWNEWREKNLELNIYLERAYVGKTSELPEADLSRVDLCSANFGSTTLYRANFTEAHLRATRFSGADLRFADFKRAYLDGADFTEARLEGADFTGSYLDGTNFGNNDLSDVKGLEAVIHQGPSNIGIQTIYRSNGKIPESFLRGCGLPESFIVQVSALIGALEPIQFYSCFISYSSKDQKFAERLHADLQSKGVRCWFAPQDLKIGDRLRTKIDESIRVHDKLLVILSRNSVESEWVEKEVETAMERERQQKRTILFPIRLDDKVLKIQSGWAADIRRVRSIGDFRKWKNHDSYQKSFDKLMRDLEAEANSTLS